MPGARVAHRLQKPQGVGPPGRFFRDKGEPPARDVSSVPKFPSFVEGFIDNGTSTLFSVGLRLVWSGQFLAQLNKSRIKTSRRRRKSSL